MKRLLLIVILIAGSLAVNGQTFTVNDLVYSVNEDGISVTVTGHVEGTEAEGSLVIPSVVTNNGNNYIVTTIARYAFAYSHNLHGTLAMGNGVTEIGYAAFVNCDGLSGNLIIPNSVVTIDSYAFQGCRSFTGDLTIPDSVVSIGTCAFDQCSGFDGTLMIGSSVTDIGNSAFILCSNINRAVCLAVEPPVLGYNPGNNISSVFYGFGCSTITVPCGSKEAYENSRWKTTYGIAGVVTNHGFNTILQDCEDYDEFKSTPVAVYPNPTKDYIQIIFSDNSGLQSVEIYTLDGRLVETFPETSQQTTIDISSLNADLYIVKLRMANGKEYEERIIKK